ncbi:MAG: hypothetical protein ACREDZ_13395 [Kiloniellales bacterium]
MPSPKRVVLVTGSPRSGTTIVGKLLGFARGTRYLYEPLHAERGVRAVKNWFEIPGTSHFPRDVADDCIRNISRLELDLKPVRKVDGNLLVRFAKRHITGTRTKVTYRLCRLDPFLRTVIWKDPLACFLVEQAATVHRIPVIATVRSPLATMASYKRLSWGTRYNDIYDLAERLREIGFVFSDRISANPRHDGEAAYGAAMFWHLIYSVLLAWHDRGVDFRFVDLDRLVARPIAVSRELYAFAGLDLGQSEERKIGALYGTKSASKDEPSHGRVHDMRRSPKSITDYWRRVLTAAEIDFCRSLNADLWDRLVCVANPQRQNRAKALSHVG